MVSNCWHALEACHALVHESLATGNQQPEHRQEKYKPVEDSCSEGLTVSTSGCVVEFSSPVEAPCITLNASICENAALVDRPECTPAAAYNSGYYLAIVPAAFVKSSEKCLVSFAGMTIEVVVGSDC